MKGFLLLVCIGLTATVCWQNIPKWAEPSAKKTSLEKVGSTPPPAERKASDDARKFDMTIEQVIPGGAAIASGCYYDIPPSQNTHPENLGGVAGKWSQAGRFYVLGIPSGLVDGVQAHLWMERAGTKTYVTAMGSYRTVPQYEVVPEPIGKATPAQNNQWIWDHGRTSLDQKTHR